MLDAQTERGVNLRIAPLLSYNGHLVCIQGRLEASLLPPLTAGISPHEVALGSTYPHCTNTDWHEWRRAGQTLFKATLTRRIVVRPMERVAFDALPRALAELKPGASNEKLVVQP